jgi:hypothetical protein
MTIARRLLLLSAFVGLVIVGAIVWRDTRLVSYYGPDDGEVVPALPVPGEGGTDDGAWFSTGGLAEWVPSLVPLVVIVLLVSALDRRRRRRRRQALRTLIS